MLTKNTNILFDPNEYKKLVDLAGKKNASVGKLIRTAVRITYFVKEKPTKKNWLPDKVFGAWKDNPKTNKELANILSGSGLEFNAV